MNQNELDSTEITEIIKLIADTFYITFLPVTNNWEEDKKNIDKYLSLFSNYIHFFPLRTPYQNLNYNIRYVFDRKKFISDAKTFTETNKEIYLTLLPADLLGCDDKELDKIENAYEEIKKLSLKGGYIRAVLETLYDEKYKTEFNKLTEDFLEKAWKLKENFSFNLVLSFMKIALNDFNRKDYENHSWNYSEATHIKAIGSTKKGKVEKVDNPYSAYKVFAQGEYSKLLIGYETDPLLPLSEMLQKGFESILTDVDICTYKTQKEGKEIKIIPFDALQDSARPYKKDFADESEYHKKLIEWRRKQKYLTVNLLILEKQTKEITTLLQKFNTSEPYVPYNLDYKLKDENQTLRQKIFFACKDVYFKNCKLTGDFSNLEYYKDNSLFDESECDFINRYFNFIYNALENIESDGRKEFDIKTNNAFSTKRISVYEKLTALFNLVDTGNIVYHPEKNKVAGKSDKSEKTIEEIINGLSENEIYQGLVNKYKSENTDYITTNESGDEIDGLVTAEEENNLFSNKELSNPSENTLENVMDSYSENLMNLFTMEFQKDEDFLNFIHKYLTKIRMSDSLPLDGKSKKTRLIKSLSNAIPDKKDEVKSYMERQSVLNWDDANQYFKLNRNTIEKVKMDFALECLDRQDMLHDKKRNWTGSWEIYKKRFEFQNFNETDEELAHSRFNSRMTEIERRWNTIRY